MVAESLMKAEAGNSNLMVAPVRTQDPPRPQLEFE